MEQGHQPSRTFGHETERNPIPAPGAERMIEGDMAGYGHEIGERQDREELMQEVLTTAKHVGQATLDAGVRTLHTVEEKLHSMREEASPEQAKKARIIAGAGAGAAALAGSIRMATKKRSHRRTMPAPRMHVPSRAMARAKDMLPNR